jgi:hypothetical protein
MLLVAISAIPSTTVRGQFATNTPLAEDNTFGTAPTAVPTSGFSFATNTPEGPTASPTNSPTPTSSPTATATATFTPTATPTNTNTPSPTPTFIGPFQYPDGINTLTGLPFPDEEARGRRNLIIKISNYPPLVRPQTGLNQADIVYEYEVEGGVTRFAAIFRSQTPPLVGSVRSARLLDMELTTMYDAFLAYSGTSEPIQNLLVSPPFFNFNLLSPLIGDNCEDAGFCRYPDGDKPFEHTLFAEPEKLWEVAAKRNAVLGIKAKGFAFSDILDANGEPANDIFLDWYGQVNARWQYDEATGRYVRYTDGLPHFDAGDGEQLWTDNIVVVEVPHVERPDLFPEGATYVSQEIQLWDQGRAYVLRDGQFFLGYWRRQNREPGSALQVIYGDNTPIMLKPGRTWVEVVRGFGDVTISGDYADMSATATAIALTPTPTPLDIQDTDGG